MEIIRQILLFIQNAITTLTGFTDWLWTPWQGLTALTGVQISPIMVFGSGLIVVILGLHIAHLVNVIAG